MLTKITETFYIDLDCIEDFQIYDEPNDGKYGAVSKKDGTNFVIAGLEALALKDKIDEYLKCNESNIAVKISSFDSNPEVYFQPYQPKYE